MMPCKQQSVIGSLFLWPPVGSHREDQNSSQVGRGFKTELGCGCVYTREAQGGCCPVAQCSVLCDPTDSGTLGFPVLLCLPEFAQTHDHWCHPTISSSAVPVSSCRQSFPASGCFQMSRLFASGPGRGSWTVRAGD